MSFNGCSIASDYDCKPKSDNFLINYYSSNTARYNLRPETCCQSIDRECKNSDMDTDNILSTRTRFRRKIINEIANGKTVDENENHEIYNNRTQNRGIKRPRAQRTTPRKQRKIETTSFTDNCTGSVENQPRVDAGNKNLNLSVDLSKITLPECSIKLKNNLNYFNDDVKETNNDIDTFSTENNNKGSECDIQSTMVNNEEKATYENASADTPLMNNLQNNSKQLPNQDDSISLYASSIAEENSENPNQQSGSGDNSYILNWLQKLENQNYEVQNSHFNNPHYKHHHSNRQHRFNRPRINFSNWHNNTNNYNRVFLLKELNDVCKFYFFEGNCIYRKCRYAHNLRDATKSRLLNLSFERFKYIYHLSKEYQNLYFPILELFIMKLTLKKDANELVRLTDDVLNHECLDRSQYIEQIVYGLQRVGLSLAEAVTKIFMFQFNKGTNSCVNEILLHIIVKENKHLEKNWFLVRKLTQNFQEMDFGVVTDILQSCLDKQPPSYNFCMQICTDILEKFDINLYNISKSVLDKFKSLLRQMKLNVYANTIDLVQGTFNETSNKVEVEEGDNKSLICEYDAEKNGEKVEECCEETELMCEKVNDDIAANFVSEVNEIVMENIEKPSILDENTEEVVDNDITELNENETTKQDYNELDLNLDLNNVHDLQITFNNDIVAASTTKENAFIDNPIEEVCTKNLDAKLVADENTNSSITHCIQTESRCSEELAPFNKQNKGDENVINTTKEISDISFNNNEVDVQRDVNVDNCDKMITSPIIENNPKSPNIRETQKLLNDKIKITSIVNVSPKSPTFSLLSHYKNLETESMISEEMEEEEPIHYANYINASPALNIDLLEEDIIRLNEVIKKESVDGITVMLRKNKHSFLRKSLILNIIVILRNQNKIFKDYVESLFKFRRTLFGDDCEAKTLLESLALNLIETLGEKGKWNRACNIFKCFDDVEDIINAECYVNKKSLLQRYFFSCLILIRGNELERASLLIKNSKVNMLDVNTWTDYEERDVHRQITILTEYFDAALENNLLFQTYDLICYIMKKQYLLKIDVWSYLNSIILKMNSDFNMYYDEMLEITNNIVSDVWDIKKFSTVAVRSLVKIMAEKRFQTAALNLYKKCYQLGIYYNEYDGTERSICIRVDMSIDEIIMIITNFLAKLVKNTFRLTDVTIHICFPLNIEEIYCKKNLSDVNTVKKNVQKIVTCLFRPVSLIFSDDDSNTDIVLKASDISAYIKTTL